MTDRGKAYSVLTMNTLAFTVCFAVWMMNGVLITFLTENRIYTFDKAQIGWLMGIPVLTGSVIRLPVGLLTDRFGGRIVFAVVMLIAAAATFALSYADSFMGFALGSLGFGIAGTTFAVGIAYTSIWFKSGQQGTALGIFGAGNAGSAITSLGGPLLLRWLTDGGAEPEKWRHFPKIYAAGLVAMTVLFLLGTHSKKVDEASRKTLVEQLRPLKHLRVWRFGLYYFLVFGGFVALAQWLIPYYVSAYGMSLAMAGLLATIFNLPSGVIRALGGWMSDKLGARTTMFWVLGVCAVCCFLLIVPRMDITSPGESVMAAESGEVTAVSKEKIVVGAKTYPLREKPAEAGAAKEGTLIWPTADFWQEPAVAVGEKVKRRQLLARGVTHIYFQANVWVFTILVFIVGIAMGIGKAAVYKFIPEYFPRDVGVVGGIVGVIGGLGGFVGPIIFGYLLRETGLWTTCWMFFFVLSVACFLLLYMVARRLMAARAPLWSEKIEDHTHDDHHSPAAAQGAPSPALTGPGALKAESLHRSSGRPALNGSD